MTRQALIFARNTSGHAHFGGMETSFDALARVLSNAGFRLSLVTTSGFDHQSSISRYFGDIWVIKGSRTSRYSATWWSATGGPGPWDERNFDVAIGIGDAAGGYALRRGRLTPLIIQSHGTPPLEAASALGRRSVRGAAQATLNMARWPSRRRFYRRAEEIWAVSESVSDSIKRIAGRREGVVVMPNAVDASALAYNSSTRLVLRRRLGIDSQDSVGLFLGRLDRQKGADVAIRAINDASSPLRELLVAGDGPERAQLARLNEQLGGRARFIGHVDRSEVPALCSAADVLLFPTTRKEGLPMILLEAAASGLPIVTTEAAGVPASLRGSMVRVAHPSTRAFNDAAHAAVFNRGQRRSYLPDTFNLRSYETHCVERIESIVQRAPRIATEGSS